MAVGKLGKRGVCTVSCPVLPPDPGKRMPEFKSPQCKSRLDVAGIYNGALEKTDACDAVPDHSGPVLPLARKRQYPEHSAVAKPTVGPLRYEYSLGHTLPGRSTFHAEPQKFLPFRIPHHEFEDFRKTVVRNSVLNVAAPGLERSSVRSQIIPVPDPSRVSGRADARTSLSPVLSSLEASGHGPTVELSREPRLSAPPQVSLETRSVPLGYAGASTSHFEAGHRNVLRPRLVPEVRSGIVRRQESVADPQMESSTRDLIANVKRRPNGKDFQVVSPLAHAGPQPPIGVAGTRLHKVQHASTMCLRV